MKKLSYFIALACIALFASCSSDVDDFDADLKCGKGDLMTIDVAMPGADGTRVAFNNDVLTDLVWKEGDQLMVVDYYSNYDYAGNYLTNPIKINKEDPKSGKFQIKQTTNYFVQFAYNGAKVTLDTTNPDGIFNCNYDTQEQLKRNSTAHLIEHLCLKTALLTSDGLTSETRPIQLAPSCAILKLNIKSLPDIIKDASDFDVKFFVNYNDAKQRQRGHMVYKDVIVTGTNENNYLYMAFDPNGKWLAQGKNIGFEITANNKIIKAYAASKFNGNKTYEAGKIYTVTLDYANDTDPNDKWTWELPQAGAWANLVDMPFTSSTGWSGWTTPDQDLGGAWYLGGEYMEAKTQYAKVTGNVDQICTLISPAVTLGAFENKFSFQYKILEYQNSNPEQKFMFMIRLAGSGEEGWVNIMPQDFTQYKWLGLDTNKNPIEHMLDAKYNGKSVEFAFRTIKQKQQGDTVYEVGWLIKNLLVQGR